ncbi:MAG: urease subunit beta [Chloroflexota bacterium]|nr:urease subunit beta [Chloroflexota bacterium]
MIPGQIIPADEPVEINAGLPVTMIDVTNTGDVPVHLTAHFHVFEANLRLAFDRRRAWGMRLDVPAGGSARFEPGETRTISLVPIGGYRVIYGFNGAVNGPLDTTDVDEALANLVRRGFLHRSEDGTQHEP